jgi:hypothetical protein
MNRSATLQFVRTKPGEPTTFRFCAVTSGRKADGVDLVVDEAAVDLGRYRANPIILASHDLGRFPIGRAAAIIFEPGKLLVDIIFDEASAAGKEVARMVRDGFLNAVSASFEILKVVAGRAVRWRLIEISVVGVPLDADCLVQRSYRPLSVPPASVVFEPQTPQEALVAAVVARLQSEQEARAARLAGLKAEVNRFALHQSLNDLQAQLRRT